MGKIVRFRKSRRRWTRARDYVRKRRAPKPPRFGRKARVRQDSWTQAWQSTRPFVLLIALVTLFVIYRQPELVGAPGFISTQPQQISARWASCSGFHGAHCVIDGDTFRIGRQSYRLMGFDTPETDARCENEAELATRATERLIDWLNEGPFWMTGRFDEPTDRYGRQLREVYRTNDAGRTEHVGAVMVGEGLARRYYGGSRSGWC